MAAKSDVKMGGAFVRLWLQNDLTTALTKTLKGAGKSLTEFGSNAKQLGGSMMAGGAAIAAPLAGALAVGANFQDIMLDIAASTGLTSDELARLNEAALAAKVGPSAAAESFLELLKAGMSLEDVLGGAGQAAIAFGKVGKMATGEAAVVMADSMKVFAVSADVAANTISAAADASSTDIQGMAQAFSQVSAVAALADQSIQDTAAALAVLANAGVKGSDAGTSLKTMLLRLMAPTDDSAAAMTELGLQTENLRDGAGNMLPLVQIIAKVNAAMAGMDEAAKDNALRRIFGTDAIRAAAILTSTGVEGFSVMRDGMASALPVGEKFATMMSGLTGAKTNILASLERLAIVVSDALGPALTAMVPTIERVVETVQEFVANNKGLVIGMAAAAAALTIGGGALMALGYAGTWAGAGLSILGGAVSLVGGAMGIVTGAIGFLLSPLGLLVAGLAIGLVNFKAIGQAGKAAIDAIVTAFGPMAETIKNAFGGISTAIQSGDFLKAAEIAGIGIKLALLQGIEGIGQLLPASLQPITDVLRTIGGMLADGKFAEAGDLAMEGISEAFSWAMDTVQANWDIWLDDMSKALYRVIGEVWGWWNEKVTEMVNKLLGDEQETQIRLNAEEVDKAVRAVEQLKALKDAMIDEKGKPIDATQEAMLNKNLNAVDKELAAAERRVEWLRGTGLGGEANAPGAAPITGPAAADTSVADRERRREELQASADARKQRLKELFGVGTGGAAGGIAGAGNNPAIQTLKDQLAAATDTTEADAEALMAAMFDERDAEEAAYQASLATGGAPGAGGPGAPTAAAPRGVGGNLATYNAQAAQLAGFQGGGTPEERTATGVDKLIATVQKQLDLLNEQNVNAKNLLTGWELLRASFSYG